MSRPRDMRLTIIDFMSIDGVVQAPGGKGEDDDGGFRHGGWSHKFMDPDVMGSAIGEALDNSEALLFGRRTWEGMAAAWPGRAGDPFADQMNAIRKYVVSSTLEAGDVAARWDNSKLISFDEVAGLRDQGGDKLLQVWGSASLARRLVEQDLVDEYILMLEPILLGGGKTIFPSDGNARELELVDVKRAATGTLVCTYRPVS